MDVIRRCGQNNKPRELCIRNNDKGSSYAQKERKTYGKREDETSNVCGNTVSGAPSSISSMSQRASLDNELSSLGWRGRWEKPVEREPGRASAAYMPLQLQLLAGTASAMQPVRPIVDPRLLVLVVPESEARRLRVLKARHVAVSTS